MIDFLHSGASDVEMHTRQTRFMTALPDAESAYPLINPRNTTCKSPAGGFGGVVQGAVSA